MTNLIGGIRSFFRFEDYPVPFGSEIVEIYTILFILKNLNLALYNGSFGMNIIDSGFITYISGKTDLNLSFGVIPYSNPFGVLPLGDMHLSQFRNEFFLHLSALFYTNLLNHFLPY